MKLYIKDRLYFPQLLPAENSYMDFNLKKSVIGKIAITKEDAEKFGIEEDQKNKTIKWNSNADHENPLEVEFSKEELQYIRRGCEALSETAYPDEFWGVVEKVYAEK